MREVCEQFVEGTEFFSVSSSTFIVADCFGGQVVRAAPVCAVAHHPCAQFFCAETGSFHGHFYIPMRDRKPFQKWNGFTFRDG